MMKKVSYKDYNKWITTFGNGNAQCHDQEESNLNRAINANSGTPHTHWTLPLSRNVIYIAVLSSDGEIPVAKKDWENIPIALKFLF